MKWSAEWIAPVKPMGDVCPEFCRQFSIEEPVRSAVLTVTAMGVYEVTLNHTRVSDDVLAPGWTSYKTRHQYQCYDVTNLICGQNTLRILLGKGWYRSPIPGWITDSHQARSQLPAALIAQLDMELESGRRLQIKTDPSWKVRESFIRFSEIYDGETADVSVPDRPLLDVQTLALGTGNLIPQQGERITEQDRIRPKEIFRTPKGETAIDFGQEVTGYVEFTVHAKAGDFIEISHAEVLDRDGNFYTENYRAAKAKLRYICRDGKQTFKPHLTFFGFRYIRLDSYPTEPSLDDFTAILVSSELRRTGTLRCGLPKLNKLFDNIVWSQRDNFLDVPTDCPQRDERLGWTGDVLAFIKTACYNYDVQKFFHKWLADLAVDQRSDGSIPHVIPDVQLGSGSAAWDDTALFAPWQLYLTYADKDILEAQFDSMNKYLSFIQNTTNDAYLWTGGTHFGDWLGLDAETGCYKGKTREVFIASAFYAYDAMLLGKIAKIIGRDPQPYEQLHQKIVEKFRATFPTYETQTEVVLALQFGITETPQEAATMLAQRVEDCGKALETGFVGTPQILYALSRHGYETLAYDLLLREAYPSWLYSVNKGATTVWEHWDGLMENGEFWSADMNSFNHYAYGSVMGWVYEEAAGIQLMEEKPGFEQVCVCPKTDRRLGWLEAQVETRYGTLFVGWKYEGDVIRHEIRTPVKTKFCMREKEYWLEPGQYVFFGPAQ